MGVPASGGSQAKARSRKGGESTEVRAWARFLG